MGSLTLGEQWGSDSQGDTGERGGKKGWEKSEGEPSPLPLQSALFQCCNKLHLMQSMNQPKITGMGFLLLYWTQCYACYHLYISLYQPPPLAEHCLRPVFLSRAQELLCYSSPQISHMFLFSGASSDVFGCPLSCIQHCLV